MVTLPVWLRHLVVDLGRAGGDERESECKEEGGEGVQCVLNVLSQENGAIWLGYMYISEKSAFL